MIKKKSDLVVITEVKNLATYIITVTEKSPKKFRYTFINKLHSYILDVIENLYLANEVEVIENNLKNYELRKNFQTKALTKLKLLDYLAALSYEAKAILFKEYEEVAKRSSNCIRLINRWMKSDLNRFKIVV